MRGQAPEQPYLNVLFLIWKEEVRAHIDWRRMWVMVMGWLQLSMAVLYLVCVMVAVSAGCVLYVYYNSIIYCVYIR